MSQTRLTKMHRSTRWKFDLAEWMGAYSIQQGALSQRLVEKLVGALNKLERRERVRAEKIARKFDCSAEIRRALLAEPIE